MLYNFSGDIMEKYKKYILTIISILFIIIATIYSKNELFNNSNNDAIPSSVSNNITQDNSHSNLAFTEAKVTKVVDGDTIWVEIDGKTYKVRLIGINCPEYTKEIEPYGKEATDYTYENINGKTVYLMSDITDTDDYDRLLRYVWTQKVDEINEENISKYLFNAKLIQEGLAYSNYYKPNILLQSYLENFEKEAKESKKGMWQ